MKSFDLQMKQIHDHLYASSNIRVPEDLQHEVVKCMQAITWIAAIAELPKMDDWVATQILSGDRSRVSPVARELRDAFAAYNRMVTRYPARETLKLNDASLAYIRAALNDVDLSDAHRDWLGDALEVFRSTAAKRLGGQFFTDQLVTWLAVELLQYDPEQHDFLDICAGTGGFLLAAARKTRLVLPERRQPIRGIDADTSLTQLANATVSQVAELDEDCVVNADSLRSPDRWPLALRKAVVPGTHARLATNPPFGQKITIKDEAVLRRYDLARVWQRKDDNWVATSRRTPTPPDILFVEQNVNLLVPGQGRVAMILPYQILSGPKLGYVRQWILCNTRVLSVVDLPDVTFQPWTGTKTALVVLERRERPLADWADAEPHSIFMASSRHIGHDRRGNAIVGSEGKRLTDIPAVAESFEQHVSGQQPSAHPEAFAVSSDAITWETDLRLNAAFYEPGRMEQLAGARQTEGTKTIGDVVERIFFPGRFKRSYVDTDDGVPFLGGTNVTQLLPTNEKFISKDDPKLDLLRVRAGWVLVTRSGSTGIVSSVPEAWDGYAMSEHVIRIVPDSKKLPGEYLEAYLRSSVGQTMLAQGIFGSVIDEITPEHVASIPLMLPLSGLAFDDVVAKQREANECRNRAILLSVDARNALDEVMTGQMLSVREDAQGGLATQDVIDEREKLVEGQVALHRI